MLAARILSRPLTRKQTSPGVAGRFAQGHIQTSHKKPPSGQLPLTSGSPGCRGSVRGAQLHSPVWMSRISFSEHLQSALQESANDAVPERCPEPKKADPALE